MGCTQRLATEKITNHPTRGHCQLLHTEIFRMNNLNVTEKCVRRSHRHLLKKTIHVVEGVILPPFCKLAEVVIALTGMVFPLLYTRFFLGTGMQFSRKGL